MNPHERAQLIGRASQTMGKYFESAFQNAGVPVETKETSIQATPLSHMISTKAYGGSVTQELSRILSKIREGNLKDDYLQTNQRADAVQQIQGKTTLRSRFTLPGHDDLLETPEQQVSDSVQADLFGFSLTLPEVGLFNKLYYNYAVWLKMTQEFPNYPRTIMPDEYTMPFHTPWQYHQMTPELTEELLNIKYEDEIRMLQARDLPGSANILMDNMGADRFVDVAMKSPNFRPDPNLPMPFDFDNYLGFRPLTDPCRQPLTPAYQMKSWPVDPLRDLAITETYGFKTFMSC